MRAISNALRKACLLAGLSLLFTSQPSFSEQKTERQLKEIQQELKKRQSGLKKQQNEQEKAQAALKRAELKLSKHAKALHQTRSQIKANNHEQNALKQQQQTLAKQKRHQQNALAAQLDSHFRAGSSDYLKMLLNQQSPAEIERTLTYFEYLNQARIEAIDTLQQTQARLQQLEDQLLTKQDQLETLLGQQSKQQDALKSQQNEHKRLIARIGKQVKSEQESIELLKDSEQQLKALASNVAPQRAAIQLTGLKKGVRWPAQGHIRSKYNSVRQGQIRWKGVLMSSPSGANISAIANGKVLYADWVKGMGLVMVLDHGNRYLSVYGHAQTLLRQAGDEVKAGETIALVGQSGGQTQPSLYFEVRYKGRPQNPSLWCR